MIILIFLLIYVSLIIFELRISYQERKYKQKIIIIAKVKRQTIQELLNNVDQTEKQDLEHVLHQTATLKKLNFFLIMMLILTTINLVITNSSATGFSAFGAVVVIFSSVASTWFSKESSYKALTLIQNKQKKAEVSGK